MANEKRLIDANDACESLCKKCGLDRGECERIGFCADYMDIKRLPTVDAVEVVHGRWEYRMVDPDYRYYKHECSICGFEGEDFYRYCPNCGAKMDGGNEE